MQHFEHHQEKIGFGDKEYFCPRQDGIQQYVLDEEEFIQTHAPTRGKHDFALFCINDELIGPKGILQNQAICYNHGYVIMIEKKSGHKLDGRALNLIRQRVFV